VQLAGYLRVSTDKQAEHGLGIEIQEAAIRKWARSETHRIKLWFRDEGVSGSNGLDARDELPKALGALRDGEVAGVVVYRLDRLARDLVLQEQLLAEIRRMGELYSTSASEADYLRDDPDDPSRALIRQILGAVNEYERSMIKLRLRSGRRRKAEKGGYAYGAPPFGTEARDRGLVRIPEEWATVERIRDLRSSGESLRGICTVLESEGRTTKRGGTRWHPAVVAKVLGRSEVPA
jgi:DNA invertase Pin-like site-specific DNA recombinase